MHHIIIILVWIFIVYILQIQRHIECFEDKSESPKLPEIHAYVINLDRNAERYDTFVTLCNTYIPSTHVERFAAVDGTQLQYDEIKEIVTEDVLNGIISIDSTQKRTDDSQLTRGMIGCYLSHLKLYKKALEMNQDLVLVFEDDAAFQVDLMKILSDLNEFPVTWDILLLGTIHIFDQKPYSKSWNRVFKFWGTQGYIINKNGMTKMLENSIPITKQIDHIMGYLSEQGILNVYAYKDNLVTQKSRYSDVQMRVM